ncbi:hypothetical protein [Albidovulum sp.]|uniref:hypothetical protein n=1 Tax=Albidovulum sp. TaxID=1872424 RepID=UPI0039B8DDEC
MFQLPTSSDDLLGRKQFGAGITGVGLVQRNGWTYGMLANHIWSVNREDRYGESSATFLQPFVSYSTPGGTSVTFNTESTYDWVAEEWSVPLNLSVAQIVKLGGRPVQLSAGVRYWSDSPPGGRQAGVRASASPTCSRADARHSDLAVHPVASDRNAAKKRKTA